MGITAQALYTRVCKRLKLPADDTTTYDSDVFLAHVNQCLAVVAMAGYRKTGEYTIPITSATRKYTVSDGLIEVKQAWIDGRTTGLRRTSPDAIFEEHRLATRQEPDSFYEEDESVVVDPIPDTDYTLRLLAVVGPGRVSTLESTIDLPHRYTDLMDFFCLGSYWLDEQGEGDPNYKTYMGLWAEGFAQASGVDASKRNRQFGGPIDAGQRPPRNGVQMFDLR